MFYIILPDEVLNISHPLQCHGYSYGDETCFLEPGLKIFTVNLQNECLFLNGFPLREPQQSLPVVLDQDHLFFGVTV